jgi:hypothetical protein
MRSNICKVDFHTAMGINTVHYGPFDDGEYLAFVDFVNNVKNPAQDASFECIRINTHLTGLFLEQEMKANAR